jgi:hypothetical protein
MLFDEWPTVGRLWQVLIVAVLTGLVFGGLDHEWITNAALNGISTAVMLYVVVWRRWPVDRSGSDSRTSAGAA